MTSEPPPRFLLLVPPSPSDRSLAGFKAAFGDTISEVLREVALHSDESNGAAILEIAFACPFLAAGADQPRLKLFNETQSLLSLLYKLVVVIAARDQINVEDTAGVDVRVILVAWDPQHADASDHHGSFGPVVGIAGLAHSQRPWQYAFGVESEEGEAFVKAFVTAKGSGEHSQHGTQQIKTSGDPTTSRVQGGGHYDVAVGGTFDHLHIGHKLLLTMTLFAVDTKRNDSPRSATVGITGDKLLVNKKHAEVLESWDQRQLAVEEFCDSVLDFTSVPSRKQHVRRDSPEPNGKSVDLHYNDGLVVKCTEIQDPFGPTITEEQISALVISAETRAGGQAVNQKREEKSWKALDVFEVSVLDAEEEGAVREGFDAKLSSTAIRQKMANRAAGGV